jgi:signal transduction histidine kinase
MCNGGGAGASGALQGAGYGAGLASFGMERHQLRLHPAAPRNLVPRSIIGWFVVCWSAFLLAAVIVGGLLLSLYAQTTLEQVRRAASAVAYACEAVGDRYRFFIAGTIRAPADLRDARLASGLTGVVGLALRDVPGVEGGIWQMKMGSLAYAFPTYEGTGEKTDLPQAEESRIREAAETAIGDSRPVDERQETRSQVLLLHACPLPGPIPQLAAWTMTRVTTAGGRGYGQAVAGLAVLLVVLLGSAAWLGRLLLGWSRRLARIEHALATSGEAPFPLLEPTGQRDLDRIVNALNGAGRRLSEAQTRADALARRVAEGERLAALGRVVAGVAHEIRNPIAAMRLKAENALASGEATRRDRALEAVLGQIDRLDGLLRNLLGSVQRVEPKRERVGDLAAFLAKRIKLFREQAAAQGVALTLDCTVPQATFDVARIGQALDNLILNAIQNTAAGGRVAVTASQPGDHLLLSVVDTGAGVPETIRDHLFDPFVTGRPDGTGLGLAIVRDIAQAHGGEVRAEHRPNGTTIVLELPCRPS